MDKARLVVLLTAANEYAGLTRRQILVVAEQVAQIFGPVTDALERDLEENRSEIRRHHHDFSEIRAYVDAALEEPDNTIQLRGALIAVRRIVG